MADVHALSLFQHLNAEVYKDMHFFPSLWHSSPAFSPESFLCVLLHAPGFSAQHTAVFKPSSGSWLRVQDVLTVGLVLVKTESPFADFAFGRRHTQLALSGCKLPQKKPSSAPSVS